MIDFFQVRLCGLVRKSLIFTFFQIRICSLPTIGEISGLLNSPQSLQAICCVELQFVAEQAALVLTDF